MIRSSKSSTKFANANRRLALRSFLLDYTNQTREAVSRLWKMDTIPSLLPKEFTASIKAPTYSSARLSQCIAKQASGIVRGTRQKHTRRVAMEAKLRKEGNLKQAEKLKKIIQETTVSEPKLDRVEAELDARFVSVDWKSDTKFIWVSLSSIGKKREFSVPVKRTKHMDNLFKDGKPLQGVRLSEKEITFMFDLYPTEPFRYGKTIGVDVGIKKMFVTSEGTSAKPNIHGHSMESVMRRLSRAKRGSKAFGRAQRLRRNLIGETINKQLSLDGVSELRLEDLISIRKGKPTSSFMNRWSYPDILNKLKDKAARHGVRVVAVPPSFTSQRCSQCGFVHKKNRKLELFKCRGCGEATDADFNGAVNISLPLSALPQGVRQRKLNLSGFFLPLASDNRKVIGGNP